MEAAPKTNEMPSESRFTRMSLKTSMLQIYEKLRGYFA